MTSQPDLSRILAKAKHYCAYQERSHLEVIQKLYGYGLNKQHVNELVAVLIEENYLNEERFAIQFAGGRFRIKQWGRVKIKLFLRQRKISAYNIESALDSIDEAVYMQTLKKLAIKKYSSLKTGIAIIKQLKTQQYLLQKGYERNLVVQVLKEFGKTQ